MAWLGRPQIGDCTNVVAGQVCRFRGPRHRQLPARAVHLASGPGHRDQAPL